MHFLTCSHYMGHLVDNFVGPDENLMNELRNRLRNLGNFSNEFCNSLRSFDFKSRLRLMFGP